VDFQQFLIECVATQSTIAFHQIIILMVLGNPIIRPSDATVCLLLATDSGKCEFRNLCQQDMVYG
jgi:hypothetical protein